MKKSREYIFGSISTATLRPEDLIPDFVSTLRELRGTVPKDLWNDVRKALSDSEYMNESGAEIVDDLMTELNNYAAPYHYFGAHPGDAADFGFWLQDDFQQMLKEDGGIQVDDTSHVPNDYTGEVLLVNCHGNPTLFTAKKGKVVAMVWSHV